MDQILMTNRLNDWAKEESKYSFNKYLPNIYYVPSCSRHDDTTMNKMQSLPSWNLS